MTIYKLPDLTVQEKLPEGCVIALGYFDGVHLGHRRIIDTARLEAISRGVSCGVWLICSGDGYKGGVSSLTDEAEKLLLAYEAGAEYAAVYDFSEIRGFSGESFVRDVLKGRLNVSCAVCGFNFRFGKGASMGVAELKTVGETYGMDTVITPEVDDDDGLCISSTRIRSLITKGGVSDAALLLGRPYFFTSRVLRGKRLGRKLGFPTANQQIPAGKVAPANGVYAVEVSFEENGEVFSYPGAANVGNCPTFDERTLREVDVAPEYLLNDGAASVEKKTCETYIIGYTGDLYGRCVRISFLEKLRDEEKFANIDNLIKQIKLDAERAESIFFEIYGIRK